MSHLSETIKWVPVNLEGTRKRLEHEKSQKVRIDRQNSILGPILQRSEDLPKFQTRYPFKRRYKTTQIAGIFAHAVHSKGKSFNSQYLPNSGISEWSPKKLETETDYDLEKGFTESNNFVISPPLLKKQNSDLETDKEEKWDAVESFSARIEKFVPNLYIREENKLKLSDLELKMLGKEIQENGKIDAIPIIDIMRDRVDWILYLEDLNNPDDHFMVDPIFTTDVISRRYEENEKFKNRTSRGSYVNDRTFACNSNLIDEEQTKTDLFFTEVNSGIDYNQNEDYSPREFDLFDNVSRTTHRPVLFTPTFAEWSESLKSPVNSASSDDDGPNPQDKSPFFSSSSSPQRFSFL